MNDWILHFSYSGQTILLASYPLLLTLLFVSHPLYSNTEYSGFQDSHPTVVLENFYLKCQSHIVYMLEGDTMSFFSQMVT